MLNTFLIFTMLVNFFESYVFLMVIIAILLVLVILGIRKSYILKKENEKLDKFDEAMKKRNANENSTQGHIYGK
ncbi:MAG: hypothetical protein ACK5NB_02940 [Flavobacteriaceae bacterium]